jgi:photosystem II stability/assembly factor-like uncharacterized protein
MMQIKGNDTQCGIGALLIAIAAALLPQVSVGQGITPDGIIQSIAIDPANSANVYATGNGRVYRSSNGGLEWAAVGFGVNGMSLAVDPGDAQFVYAGTVTNGVMRSTDGGNNWVASSPFDDRTDVVTTNADGSRAYAATATAIYYSDDKGTSWLLLTDQLGDGLTKGLAVDPFNPNIIYASKWGQGVFRSVDGGISWINASTGLFDTQIFDLDVHPVHSSILFVCTPAGVFQSVDAGGSWRLQAGPTRVSELAIDPNNPDRMIATTEGLGVHRTSNRGQAWEETSQGLNGATVFTGVAISHNAESTAFAGSSREGLFVSGDFGESWSRIVGDNEPVIPPPPPTVSDPTSLEVAIVDHLNGESVPSGSAARFTIKVRNSGGYSARNATLWAGWSVIHLVGGNDPYSFDISSSQGSCSRYSCTFTSIPINGEVSVTVNGHTREGALNSYRLNVSANADNADPVGDDINKPASVTIFETGGGSAGIVLPVVLLILLLWRRRHGNFSERKTSPKLA